MPPGAGRPGSKRRRGPPDVSAETPRLLRRDRSEPAGQDDGNSGSGGRRSSGELIADVTEATDQAPRAGLSRSRRLTAAGALSETASAIISLP